MINFSFFATGIPYIIMSAIFSLYLLSYTAVKLKENSTSTLNKNTNTQIKKHAAGKQNFENCYVVQASDFHSNETASCLQDYIKTKQWTFNSIKQGISCAYFSYSLYSNPPPYIS